MVQEPAVPKWQRLKLRALTRLLGPQGAARFAQAASERAALALRSQPPAASKAQQVTFLIPLVGRHHVSDWKAVQARLSLTLQSLLDQTDPNWRVLICCQDAPALPKDPRITHLPFTDPGTGNDKWRKLATLCLSPALAQMPPGYVMSFDADDLLHRTTIERMLAQQAKGGYLVETGLVMDHATGEIAQARRKTLRQPMQKPFWKLCGSCAALRHDPAHPGASAFLAQMTAHEHRMFPYLASLAGHRLTPLTPASVLYILNHGENFGARRGRVGFKTRFVEKYKLPKAKRTAAQASFPKD